jgi:hypothetical protein
VCVCVHVRARAGGRTHFCERMRVCNLAFVLGQLAILHSLNGPSRTQAFQDLCGFYIPYIREYHYILTKVGAR